MMPIKEVAEWLASHPNQNDLLAIDDGGLALIILPADFISAKDEAEAERIAEDPATDCCEVGGIPIADNDLEG